ncbi:MAG: hypothetical protein AAFQ23_00460 [Cyanobacteria bacterium J06623_1]
MPRKKRNSILPVCDKAIPSKFRWVAEAIESQILQLSTYQDGREVSFIAMSYYFHYLIKKEWNSRHKLPSVAKAEKEAVNANADIYHQAYRLAVKCFEDGIGYSESYSHPSIWFAGILEELSLSEGNIARRLSFLDSTDSSKPDYLDLLREDYSQIRQFNNPYDPNNEPHTWRLIESASEFAEQTMGRGVFYRDFWRPFLKSRGDRFIKLSRSTSTILLKKYTNGDRYINSPGTRGQSKVLFIDWYYANSKSVPSKSTAVQRS